jgi:hypothetical protein
LLGKPAAAKRPDQRAAEGESPPAGKSRRTRRE